MEGLAEVKLQDLLHLPLSCCCTCVQLVQLKEASSKIRNSVWHQTRIEVRADKRIPVPLYCNWCSCVSMQRMQVTAPIFRYAPSFDGKSEVYIHLSAQH